MACLSGGESRRWTVGELVERFKNLGVCATRASVTAALAELALELELSSWAPWRLLERGTEWILAPKSELLELLSGVRRLPLKEAEVLSEEHKAVLLVVIGYRQKGGVSKARVGEILGLDASSYLDDLLSQGLIYCDPSRELNFWRPTPSALLALGLLSHTDIPALKELEEWFDTQKEMRVIAKLDPFFERTSKLASRRLKRELERRGTLGEPWTEPVSSPRGSPRRKAALIFSGVMGWLLLLLRSPATLSRRRALCRAARPKGAPFGPGKRSLDWLHLRDLR